MRRRVELGSGPRHSVRLGRFRDMLRYSGVDGETPQAQGHVSRESVEPSPGDAGGESGKWKERVARVGTREALLSRVGSCLQGGSCP